MTVLALDVDGVIVRGNPDGGRWDKDVQRDFGIGHDDLQRFFREHWTTIELGNADLFDVLEGFWPQFACRGNARDFVDYWFAKDSRLDDAVLTLVDGWRVGGKRAYLATVQEHHRARYLWDTLKLRDHFDGNLYSAALGTKKPYPDYFTEAQAKMGVTRPDEILFLDDRQDNVDVALAAGWCAYLFREADDLRRVLADKA